MMAAVLLGLLLCAFSATAHEVSVSCMMAYDKGGALAVFQSPECPQWVLSTNGLQNQTRNCQYSTLKGHREYQEDRVKCNLDLRIPVLGEDGPKEVVVGVLAIFDGHGGKEASEMASENLLDYFLLHVVFSTYKQSLPSKNKHDLISQGKNNTENNMLTFGSSQGVLPVTDDNKPIHGILKEALLGAIHDIDMKFSLEALNNNYASGSTAIVVLLLDGKYLVASVGDSKALLCSDEDSLMTKLDAEELTRDHHPGRDDEKARIEAAGGFIRLWDVPRVNGILAVSRSIGDIHFKRYGVIALPEVLGWQPLKDKDRYLVIASDGIFESLTPQDVCNLLQNSDIQESEVSNNSSVCSSSSSLAGCIVNTALRNGSMDNLSAIVVPLGLAGFSKQSAEER